MPCLLCRSLPFREAFPRAPTPQIEAVSRSKYQSCEVVSLLTALRLGWTRSTRATNLRFRYLFNFGQHQRRVVLQRSLHRVIVAFGIFSRAKLKAQVSQIVVNRV